MRIINFGSLNIDHVYQVDHISRPGETIASADYAIFAGGKGANQSVAIAKAGGSVMHIGKIGHEGVWMVEKMEHAGVDVSKIIINDEPGGHAIIQVDKKGQNSIVIHGGTNRMFTENDIDTALGRTQADDVILVQNEINNIPYLINQAAQKGLSICLNPAPMGPEVKEYPLDKVSIFIINQTEGEALTGKKNSDEVITEMLKKFPESKIIMTLGSKGAIYADASQRISVPGMKVKVVDTTGAGDTFIGYFVACYSKKMEIQMCLEMANKAAAHSVTKKGAVDSIPYFQEVHQ